MHGPLKSSQSHSSNFSKSSSSLRLPLKNNEDESQKNPFALPKGREWLSLRRNYAVTLFHQRATERNQKEIYKKHTFRSRHQGTALPRMRKLLRSYDAETQKKMNEVDENRAARANAMDPNTDVDTATRQRDDQEHTNIEEAYKVSKQYKNDIGKKSNNNGDSIKNQSGYRTKPIQREFVTDIIANKRQLFLAEYVLQTKRQALSKMQESVQAAEKDLTRSEKKLEADATAFDEFLKETDKTAVDAMVNAEKVSAIRLQLVEDVKNLHLKKAMLQSELSRFDEMLFQYLQMKRFIWKIFHDHNRHDEKSKAIIKNIDEMIAVDENGQPQADCDNLVNKNIKDRDLEEQSIPFKTEDSILEIIGELEDNNLSMIHHFQHSEELVEDLKSRENIKRQKLKNDISSLKHHIEVLESKIEQREKRAKELAFVCKMYETGNYESDQQDQVLEQLCQKIEKVYKVVVGQLEIKIDGLMMLTSVENRLEDLIDEIESFPMEKVRLAQKFKDKQRRLKLREEKQQEQRQKQEERAKRAQERAQAMAFRQKGRKLIFRSDPVKNGKLLTGESELRKNKNRRANDDNAEFFTW
jgi:hypothetical protein